MCPHEATRDTVVLHLMYMTLYYLSCLTSAEHFSNHSVWPTYPSHIIPVQVFTRSTNIFMSHLVNNRVYIHVHAVIYSVTFNYFTYVCRNKSPTGLML